MLKGGDSVDTLIEKVSSKGGTTIAALDAMKDLGFYDAVKKVWLPAQRGQKSSVSNYINR